MQVKKGWEHSLLSPHLKKCHFMHEQSQQTHDIHPSTKICAEEKNKENPEETQKTPHKPKNLHNSFKISSI